MTCPNGCDLDAFGGTHQGPPDCDLKPSNPDASLMVEVRPGLWLRSGVTVMFRNPLDGGGLKCPACSTDRFTVLMDGGIRCDGCGAVHRMAQP